MHCFSRNLTVRSSRNTPFRVIVAFSTIPMLRQFPLAEKTGSPWNAFQEPDSWIPSRLWLEKPNSIGKPHRLSRPPASLEFAQKFW
jgi:hypothetical protein